MQFSLEIRIDELPHKYNHASRMLNTNIFLVNKTLINYGILISNSIQLIL